MRASPRLVASASTAVINATGSSGTAPVRRWTKRSAKPIVGGVARQKRRGPIPRLIQTRSGARNVVAIIRCHFKRERQQSFATSSSHEEKTARYSCENGRFRNALKFCFQY